MWNGSCNNLGLCQAQHQQAGCCSVARTGGDMTGPCSTAALQHGHMSADNPVSHITTVQQQQSAGQIPTVQLVQCCSGLTGSTTMAAGPGSAQCAQCRSGYSHTHTSLTVNQ